MPDTDFWLKSPRLILMDNIDFLSHNPPGPLALDADISEHWEDPCKRLSPGNGGHFLLPGTDSFIIEWLSLTLVK